MAGFVYGYLYAHYFPYSDSWMFFEESLKEYQYLLHEPSKFFTTDVEFHNMSDVFSNADDASWRNFDDNLFIKILGLLNILSFGNYYVNVILFNFFPTLGLYYIYKTSLAHYRVNRLWLALLVFALPSCLFWNSGLHKDGMIVFFTGIFIASFYKSLQKNFSLQSIATILFALFCLFLFRNVSAMLLVLPAIAWWYCTRSKIKPVWIFLIITGSFATLFFTSMFLPQQYNLPLKFAEKQQQFLLLEGNSFISITPLQPTLSSYFEVLPQALNHGFLRPYITEIRSPFYIMAFAEIALMFGIIVYAAINSRKRSLSVFSQPYSLFLFTTAILALLIIGYTVPFIGAIVRYKAFYLVLILIPLLPLLSKPEHTSNKNI